MSPLAATAGEISSYWLPPNNMVSHRSQCRAINIPSISISNDCFQAIEVFRRHYLLIRKLKCVVRLHGSTYGVVVRMYNKALESFKYLMGCQNLTKHQQNNNSASSLLDAVFASNQLYICYANTHTRSSKKLAENQRQH